MSYGFNAYKKTNVSTASREKVLLMLYEGAIKQLKLAITALKNGQIAQKGEAILKVQDIVNELNNCLNHNVGGEISRNLEQLYNFVVDQTTASNMTNEVAPLENALQVMENLLEGWQGAVEEVRRQGGLDNIKIST